MIGKWQEIKMDKKPVHYIDDKRIIPFEFKCINNNGEIKQPDKWYKSVREIVELFQETKEHELKCIYCQLFLNKYLGV